MRSFIIKALLFSFIVISILGSCIFYKIYVTRHLSFKESPDVHFLFIGASHPFYGIDDSLMRTAVNRSATSERYMFSYLKLKKILAANPQIDTVFLECSSTDLWEHTDDKYFKENDMSKFLPLYFPLFSTSEWSVYKYHLKDVIPLIIQKTFTIKQLKEQNILEEMGRQASKEENTMTMRIEDVYPNMVRGSHGNEVNFRYLRKIIKLCSDAGVKLYGVYFPVYHPEYYYDQTQYYSTLQKEFPDLELLDYHAMELPDTLRRDAHHLNWPGSQLFTKEIMARFNIQ